MISDLQNKQQPAIAFAEKFALPGRAKSSRQVESADLLGKHDFLTIRHQGENYFLRQTRAGKLLLTK